MENRRLIEQMGNRRLIKSNSIFQYVTKKSVAKNFYQIIRNEIQKSTPSRLDTETKLYSLSEY